MISRTLQIKEIVRTAFRQDDEVLSFTPGINVIVGKANSGKTKWLQMLDFLLGDKGTPEEAFGQELAEKYDSLRALVEICGEEFRIERRWKERGKKGKIFVEDDPLDTEEFGRFLLERLRFPIVHFPKGNPFDERSWPELSWRTLLRHIYRQQRFWGDIADKQFDSEQLASIFMFLGIAEHLYSEKSGHLVDLRKRIFKLEAQKEQHSELLDRLSVELTNEKDFQVGLTPVSLETAINNRKLEQEALQHRRVKLINSFNSSALEKTASDNGDNADEINELGKRWTILQTEREKFLSSKERLEQRLTDLRDYKRSLEVEVDRLHRTKSATRLLSDLQVTHCPVCDQPVESHGSDPDHCFLCGQPRTIDESDTKARVDLEIKRIKDELQEADQLIKSIIEDLNYQQSRLQQLCEEIQLIESRLKPIQQITTPLIPPEISILDMDLGRVEEKIQQLERFRIAFGLQAELSQQIDQLRQEAQELEAIIKDETSRIHYALSADLLSNGMTTYLNFLESFGNKVWSLGRVNALLKERSFTFTVGGDEWSSKLGGTLTLYFLMSYHYALLRLTTEEACHYPGLVILDLPPTMEDNSTVKDKENFILEPFVHLMNSPSYKEIQVIATGAAFENLDNINRIELNKVWK